LKKHERQSNEIQVLCGPFGAFSAKHKIFLSSLLPCGNAYFYI